MSLYIQGIELPKSNLPIQVQIWPDGQVDVFEHGEYWSVAKAIPVPPHWRLIDADAVYQFAKDQLVKETGAFSKGVNKALKDIMAAVKNSDAVPTIIPADDMQMVKWRQWNTFPAKED